MFLYGLLGMATSGLVVGRLLLQIQPGAAPSCRLFRIQCDGNDMRWCLGMRSLHRCACVAHQLHFHGFVALTRKPRREDIPATCCLLLLGVPDRSALMWHGGACMSQM